MIPYGLGQNVNFKKGYGPRLDWLQIDILTKVDSIKFTKNLKPVYETIKKVKKEIEKKSLIGFVGAPWTLFLYMVNKQSPKKNLSVNLCLTSIKKNLKIKLVNESLRFVLKKGDNDGKKT